MNDIYGTIGAQSLFYLVITLCCILICWWTVRQVRWDIFLKNVTSAQSKLLQVIVAVILGYQLAQFFIHYSNWASMLRGLF